MSDSSKESPASLVCADLEVELTPDEWTVLSTLNFLFRGQGGVVGRVMSVGGNLDDRDTKELLAFVDDTKNKIGATLRVYEHGHGQGTLRSGDDDFLGLVHRLGLRYQKTVPRYVKGQKGKIDRYEDVLFAKGRSVSSKDPNAQPHTLADMAPLQTLLEKLHRAAHASQTAGVPLQVRLRKAYEYF